ncbi:MAG: FG-GAP-like repeat-containing protein [Isosphaeraceae bacterium]
MRGWDRPVLSAFLSVIILGGSAGGYLYWRAWKYDAALTRARQRIDARAFAEALALLEPQEGAHPYFSRSPLGELDYQLGLCRWQLGKRGLALAAFEHVPVSSPLWVSAAPFLAEGELDLGHWRRAEEILTRAVSREASNKVLYPVRQALNRIYRMQSRFADAASVLRDAWSEEPDPVAALRQIWQLDRGTPPYQTITQALDIGAKLDPDDDRILLGRARVALGEGRLDTAVELLTKCGVPPSRPDAAVWRAWLDYADATGEGEHATRALRSLGTQLSPIERLTWRVWFADRMNDLDLEIQTVNSLLTVEPRNPRWLTRSAALATESGDRETAAARRTLKADVDTALDEYTNLLSGNATFPIAAERVKLGKVADRAGRPFDAQAWFDLARRLDPASVDPKLTLLSKPPEVANQAAKETGVRKEPWDPDVPMNPRIARSAISDAPSAALFVDIAKEAGLAHVFQNGETPIRQMPVALSGGVALLDFDGDGLLDLYAVQGGAFPPNTDDKTPSDRLFRNRGDGTFEDVSDKSLIAKLVRGYGIGVAVADYNNDGHPDLFLTRWRKYQLLRNKGDGTFEDLTKPAGLDGDKDWPTSAAFADLDNDGDLDLYVCHYVVWNESNPRICRGEYPGNPDAPQYCAPHLLPHAVDHLFRNDAGRFVDVTREAGITDPDGRGLGVVATDLDDDGKVDLFVANDGTANFLFRNLGGFQFVEIAHEAGVAGNAEGGYQAGMGVACGDIDGDTRPDLLVTNYYGESVSYFRNHGQGIFTDRTAASGIGALSRSLLGFGIAVLDANNDGRLDVLTANGHTDDLGDTPYQMPAQLMLATTHGRFIDMTSNAGPALNTPRLGRGLAIGDLDQDGRIDAVLVPQNAPLVVARNQSNRVGHTLNLQLEGRTSNRDGVGAVVSVVLPRRRLVAQRQGGGSYLSASSPRLHFGLGRIESVEAVEVVWPSGQRDRHLDLRPDRTYRLIEGDGEARILPAPRWPDGP